MAAATSLHLRCILFILIPCALLAAQETGTARAELRDLEAGVANVPRSELARRAKALVAGPEAAEDAELRLRALLVMLECNEDLLLTDRREADLEAARTAAKSAMNSAAAIDLLLFEARLATFDADFDEARRFLARAEAELGRASGAFPDQSARASMRASWLAVAEGRSDEAERLGDEAVRLAMKGSATTQRSARFSTIVLAETLARIKPDTEAKLRDLITESEAAGDLLGLGLARTELALFQASSGRLAAAIETMLDGITILDRIECRAVVVQRRVQLAGLYSALGRLEDAGRQLASALHLQEGRDHPGLVAHSRVMLGRNLAARGRLEAGLAQIERAVVVAEASGDVQLAAIAREQLGRIRARLLQPTLALREYRRAIEHFRAFGDLRSADSVARSAASLMIALGQRDQGRAILEEALRQSRSSENSYARINALLGLAQVDIEDDDPDQAERRIEEAAALGRSLEAVGVVGHARGLQAEIALRRGSPKEAEALAREAASLLAGGDSEILARVRLTLAEALRRRGKFEAALAIVDLILAGENLALAGLGDSDRTGRVRVVDQTVATGLLALVAEEAPSAMVAERALRLVEFARTLALQETLASRVTVVTATIPLGVLDDHRRARERFEESRDDSGREDAAADLLESASRLERAARGSSDLIARPDLTMTAIQEGLAPAETYVAWQRAGSRLLALVISRRGGRLVDIGEIGPVLERARTYMRFVQTPDSDDRPLARALHSDLFSPLFHDQEIPAALVLSPPPEFADLPFDALLVPAAETGPERRLVEATEILLTPSAALYFAPVAVSADRGQGLLAASDASAHEGEAALPAALAEIRSIARLFPAPQQRTLLLGEQSTRDALLAAMAGKHRRLIHLAGHGFTDTGNAGHSGIRLAGGSLLIADDLYGLRGGADLVVLAACRSVGEPRARGLALTGVARGFFGAGCPRILVTDFPVGDAAAQEFLVRFLTAFVPGRSSAASSLRAAKLAALEAGGAASHPSRWAAYALWGERR